jgi:hypothetical protein
LVFNCAAPITVNADLTWAGFTPSGVLVSVDSAGVGRVLLNAGPWVGQWVPLTQPEGKVDTSRRWPIGWPIGATDDSLIVVRLTETEEEDTGLVLDDDNRGAPIIDTVRWTAPLLNPNSALTTGLEAVLRRRVMLTQNAEPSERRELEIDSEVVKLIVLAAKNGHAQRGLELFRTIKSSKFCMAAMKWCGSNGYDALFTRMEQEYRLRAGVSSSNNNNNEELVEDDDQEDLDVSRRESEMKSSRNTKKRAVVDEVFDNEEGRSPSPPSTIAKPKKAATAKPNPFNKRTNSSLKRSASGGGIMEELARIESGAIKMVSK